MSVSKCAARYSNNYRASWKMTPRANRSPEWMVLTPWRMAARSMPRLPGTGLSCTGKISIHSGERFARAEGLSNIELLTMEEARVPLPGSSTDLIIMLQVHHELSDPPPLLADCHRLLKSGGTLAIIDWKGEDPEKGTPLEGRVPEGVIREQLAEAGFRNIAAHPIYDRHSFLTAGK